MKSIKAHLPKQQEKALIQAKIDKALFDKLRVRLKKEHVKIVDFIEASIKAYLQE